jgi:hypothetical protein
VSLKVNMSDEDRQQAAAVGQAWQERDDEVNRLRTALEDARAQVAVLVEALVAARQWMEPVIDGFGLNSETHVVLNRVTVALALKPSGAGEAWRAMVEALNTYPGIYDDGKLYAWESKTREAALTLAKQVMGRD